MCIVVDINVLAPVFNKSCERHKYFAPIKNWIEDGRGYFVYGGTKYKNELKRSPYYKLVRLLKDAGKAISIDDNVVDDMEKTVIQKTKGTDCDDQHIIAILGASKCPLLCSDDKRSWEFIKNKSLYPKKCPRVRIYTETSFSRHRKILIPIKPSSLVNIV